MPIEKNYNLQNIGAILQNYKVALPMIGVGSAPIEIPESMEVEKRVSPKIGEKSESRQKVESKLYPELPKTPISAPISSITLPSPIFPQETYKPLGSNMFPLHLTPAARPLLQSPIAMSTPQKPLTSPKVTKVSQEEEQQKAATLVNLETLRFEISMKFRFIFV